MAVSDTSYRFQHPQLGSPSSVYTYQRVSGEVAFAICRFEPKDFRPAMPTGNGRWRWSLEGAPRLLYQLPRIEEALASGELIWIVDGEKDADALCDRGAAATCCARAQGWSMELADQLIGARRVRIVADRDSSGTGLKQAIEVRDLLLSTTGLGRHEIEIVRAGDGKDAYDHFDAGLGLEEFELVNERDLTGESKSESESDNVFMNAYAFINEVIEAPPPLWGSDDVTLLPAGGLALLAGRPGCGKTTFILDLACHLACGLAYPPVEDDKAPTPWPAHRPLRIALIENEGPREMFRSKLEQKLNVFPHKPDDLGGLLMVQTWRWGSYTFADEDARIKTALELDAAQIDLVIGDPLGTLGPAGVGSPQDTREFVQMLKPLGLGINRGFLFLHHFRERVERSEDELARISGAWGGHLDTLLTLSSAKSADQARLAYPKLRWARVSQPTPIIMGRIWNTSSYIAIAEENDVSMLEPLIYTELAKARAEKTGANGEGWMTGQEIAQLIESRRTNVITACEGAPHIFVERTGLAAKALGKRPNARLWGLREWDPVEEMPEPDEFDDIKLPL